MIKFILKKSCLTALSRENDQTKGTPKNKSVCLKEILLFYFCLVFIGSYRKKFIFSKPTGKKRKWWQERF